MLNTKNCGKMRKDRAILEGTKTPLEDVIIPSHFNTAPPFELVFLPAVIWGVIQQVTAPPTAVDNRSNYIPFLD